MLFRSAAALALFVFLSTDAQSAQRSGKPNVVLILADDLGWSDTSFTGSRYYRTPNIERLGREGVYFPNAYAASPLCSPTRASIMTGQSPARCGITSPVCHVAKIDLKATVRPTAGPLDRQTVCTSVSRLSTEHYTLAEALKDGGYVTGHFGKWHLGKEPYSPLEHGFDVDIPHWPGPGPAGSFVAPWRFPRFKERKPHEHIEDRMGDEAVAFMTKNRNRPFFLNYWQFSVHAPFDAKKDLIDRYAKTVDPKNPQQCPTYAAMVHSLDDNVGKLLDAIERLGLAKNTIVIFYSDNGGNMYDAVKGISPTSNAPLRGGKASIYEGGIRIPAIVKWPGVTAGGTVNSALIQSEDLYPTILEMAGLPVRREQARDALSIVPALRGEAPLRDCVYSYFPHAPGVPEWLPPSVCVRSGDWKLIRIFHDDVDGGHRYELYDLKDDIGERVNRASREPERVRRMDALIERFLDDTKAVTPLRNPRYDPKAPNVAAGWRAGPGVRASVTRRATLQMRSFTDAPRITSVDKLDLAPGRYALEVRMRTWADGPAGVAWAGVAGRFDLANSSQFRTTPDGIWRETRAVMTCGERVHTLRIAPGAGPGTIDVEWIRVRTQEGDLVKEWRFPLPKKNTRRRPSKR
jgi:arylsulfatase A-like enzyme